MNAPITQIQNALVDPFGKSRYEELRKNIIEEFGYERFRTIQRIAFARIFNPQIEPEEYCNIYK